MREILFRGKRIDNGEWVVGDGIHYPKSFNYRGTVWIDGMEERANDWLQVIPETVGQYTGLTDKNGKKIFEGDIIKKHKSSLMGKYFDIGVVEFYKNGYFFKHTYKYKTFGNPIREQTVYCDFKDKERINAGMDGAIDYVYEYEIIGNIYDNHELLEDNNV